MHKKTTTNLMINVIRPKSDKEDKIVRALTVEEQQYFTNWLINKPIDEFNVTDISSHSLRHTFGTRCIESGVAPVVVQRLLGHKNISVTLNTYTSVFDKYKEREFDKVNQYYLNEKS